MTKNQVAFRDSVETSKHNRITEAVQQRNIELQEEQNAIARENAQLAAATSLQTAQIAAASAQNVAQINAKTSTKNVKRQTKSNQKIAKMQTKSSQKVAKMQTSTNMSIAEIQAAMNKYSTDVNAATQRDVANINGSYALQVKNAELEFQKWKETASPTQVALAEKYLAEAQRSTTLLPFDVAKADADISNMRETKKLTKAKRKETLANVEYLNKQGALTDSEMKKIKSQIKQIDADTVLKGKQADTEAAKKWNLIVDTVNKAVNRTKKTKSQSVSTKVDLNGLIKLWKLIKKGVNK